MDKDYSSSASADPVVAALLPPLIYVGLNTSIAFIWDPQSTTKVHVQEVNRPGMTYSTRQKKSCEINDLPWNKHAPYIRLFFFLEPFGFPVFGVICPLISQTLQLVLSQKQMIGGMRCMWRGEETGQLPPNHVYDHPIGMARCLRRWNCSLLALGRCHWLAIYLEPSSMILRYR